MQAVQCTDHGDPGVIAYDDPPASEIGLDDVFVDIKTGSSPVGQRPTPIPTSNVPRSPGNNAKSSGR